MIFGVQSLRTKYPKHGDSLVTEQHRKCISIHIYTTLHVLENQTALDTNPMSQQSQNTHKQSTKLTDKPLHHPQPWDSSHPKRCVSKVGATICCDAVPQHPPPFASPPKGFHSHDKPPKIALENTKYKRNIHNLPKTRSKKNTTSNT